MPSSDVIKLEYEKAAAMATAFKGGHEELLEIQNAVLQLAAKMQEGGLLGKTGEAYVQLIESVFCPAIGRFADKFTEMETDVHKAINFMKQADKDSSSAVSSVG